MLGYKNMSLQATNSKILVVDDEPDIAYSLKKGLEHRGFAVTAYENPLIALADYKPSKYDLCILDIKMPQMNGFELYREIRKLDGDVKICFCTAHDAEYHEEFRKAFPELAEQSFIPKPATLIQLVTRIEQELKNLDPISQKQ